MPGSLPSIGEASTEADVPNAESRASADRDSIVEERIGGAITGDARPVGTATAEHYVWGGSCDGWHLLRSPGLSVIQERMPPGTEEARHRHGTSRQLFYVLDGELEMEVEGAVHTLAAGQALEVAPGAAHQARNASAADAHFLVVSQPPAHGDRQPAAQDAGSVEAHPSAGRADG
ncbi:MAG: Cupin 2 conserved barrel domain protein [Gemmatimonadetes bacterium]|nr:Cupin 2 conserved barrel domain protein [Gemmatimonadota bacterium]